MPLMKTVPSPKDQPLEEHISEALGHIAWMWTNNEIAEIVLKQLGQRKRALKLFFFYYKIDRILFSMWVKIEYLISFVSTYVHARIIPITQYR